MTKIFENGKWKKRTLTALSLALAATLSLGVFSACATNPQEEEEEGNSKVAPTDTQVIKNGNFEFYSDKLVDPDDNGKPLGKKNIISTPDSWSFTSGSPSSDTKSGIIDTKDWNYFTKTGGYRFKTFTKGEDGDAEEVETFETIEEAYTHWEDENVSAYDRLKFLDIFSEEIADLDDNSDEAKLFAEYNYSIDFEDVEKFNDEEEGVKLGTSGNVFELHEGATAEDENNTSVLMIHNRRTADDGVRGTAQYYTSSTTVTLSAGTAAEISLWVRTDALYHYKDTELTQRGGAYIGVTNTVGGSTLDQMQIYNIHTDGQWQQYTLYVRASTFATSTFRIVLGLGQGSSDDKYYAVDGYAFFDDVNCKIISAEDYDKALRTDDGEGALKTGVKKCTVDSLKEEKQFDSDTCKYTDYQTFALDLYAPSDNVSDLAELLANVSTDLTAETSGSKTYTSEEIDSSLGDGADNFAGLTTFGEIKASSNKYLKNVFTNDFENKFPFGGDESQVIMLMSANGAAYTAKLAASETSESSMFRLAPDSRILISFFAKTSKIRSGLTGAGATVVDGENKTYISSFDTTTLAAVDIDSKSDNEALKDIYKGWTQCFFFIENDTETEKEFSIEFTYGPTTIVGTNKFSYGEGYAAFTGFEIKTLTKTEYGYASTGDRAKKVSLTGETEETKMFDSVSATAEEDLKTGPALPANYRGVLGGSDFVQNNGKDSVPNVKPENVYAGLLSSKYAEKYFKGNEAWKTALAPVAGDAADETEWWTNLFGSSRQPLVIINGEEAAYGFYAETETLSASSYRRISMRVRASEGAKVNLYLIDTTAEKTGTLLRPNLPYYTYWYDDDGNIVNMDPESPEYEKDGKILYELQPDGLYKSADDDGKLYANLHNFDADDDGNRITKDGTIAFFFNENDRQFYAYRDEDAKTGEYTYRTLVTDLPTTALRYDYSDTDALPEAQMTIDGTDEWVTVNFYLHTGNEAKTYRLEVWSGSRDGETKNKKDSYVFFDNYSSADASSNFETLRNEAVQAIKDKLNEDKEMGSDGYLGKDDTLPEEYARYYTFTFFDSKDYLRYDETTDEDALGNPYYSYTQSSQEEQIVWLRFDEEARKGQSARYSFYLDYSASDVTVEREYPEQNDSDTDTDYTHDDGDTDEPMNIWLLIASGSLAVVLVFAIAAVIVRRLLKNRSKRTKVKAPKDKRVKPKKPETPAGE